MVANQQNNYLNQGVQFAAEWPVQFAAELVVCFSAERVVQFARNLHTIKEYNLYSIPIVQNFPYFPHRFCATTVSLLALRAATKPCLLAAGVLVVRVKLQCLFWFSSNRSKCLSVMGCAVAYFF